VGEIFSISCCNEFSTKVVFKTKIYQKEVKNNEISPFSMINVKKTSLNGVYF